MYKVWPLLLALCFLWSFPEAFCSHFRGGTISWKPDPYIPLKVLFKFKIAWRRSSGQGGNCNAQTINSRQLLPGGQWTCLSGACNGQAVGNTDYYCTSYSAQDDWTQGENTFNFTFPSAGSYDVGFTGGSWITLVTAVAGNWVLGTTVNLVSRRDKIGVINSSPITSNFPTQIVTQGCPEKLHIQVADPDNDIVRCRWASGNGECGTVCGTYQLGNLDQASCTLSYNGQGSVGWYVVALMLEDFYPGSSSFNPSDALSKVGFQFLVKVVSNPHSSCNLKPFLTSNSPRDGACVAIPIEQTYRATLEASHNDTSRSISDIIIVAPLGMTKSTVTRTGTDSRGGGIWSTQVTWTPQQAQIGQHILCFKAQDSSGQQSSERCLTLLAGSNAPKPDLSSRSPNTSYLSPRKTYTWSVAFDYKIARPSSPRYIRFKSSGGHVVHTIDTSSSPDVHIDNTTNTLQFTVSGASLSGYRSYHILMDRGVVEGTLGCSGSGPPSLGTISSAWAFNLGCLAGFTPNSARTRCIDEDECATSNGNCSHTCANTVGSYRCACPDSELTLDADGKNCKAPGMAITCRSDSMLVTFTRQMLSGLDEQHVRLNDPNCTAAGNATHISFWVPLDGCGTTHTFTRDTITYKNKVTSRNFHVGGVITRVRKVEALVHCSYARKMTLGFVSFRPNARKLRVFESSYGNFTFLFNMFHTSSFLRAYADSEYPVDVKLRQQLYFQLQAKSNDSDLVLFVDTCKATPSAKSHAKLEYVFISSGCKVDSTLVYNYNLLPVQQFNVEAFQFIASHPVVYIHCDVIVCHKSANSSRCAQGCVSGPSIGRKRRRLASQVGTSSAHYVISEGPVRFDVERSEDKERPQEPGDENISTVPLFVVLAAAIAVLGGMSIIIALHKKKIDQPTNQSISQ